MIRGAWAVAVWVVAITILIAGPARADAEFRWKMQSAA